MLKATKQPHVLRRNLFEKSLYFGYQMLYVKYLVEVRNEVFFMIFAPAAIAIFILICISLVNPMAYS